MQNANDDLQQINHKTKSRNFSNKIHPFLFILNLKPILEPQLHPKSMERVQGMRIYLTPLGEGAFIFIEYILI